MNANYSIPVRGLDDPLTPESYTAPRAPLTLRAERAAETAFQPERKARRAVLAIEDPIAPPAAPVPPAAQEASPQRQRSLARAAQHDILRRLTPPLRHDMVVHLQSLGMMAEALSARMERGAAPDDLAGTVSKLNRLSRQAVARCLEVCTWMEPGEDDTVALRQGVNEVVRLLSTSLNFRGFDLHPDLGDGEFPVERSALRFLLAAAILTLADAAPAPGELVVRTEQSSTHGVIAVEYRPQPAGVFTQMHDGGEAPLSWVEVQALAAVHDVELLRNGQAIILRLPRAVVTTPLKMVPV
jgi:hypothetical protein